MSTTEVKKEVKKEAEMIVRNGMKTNVNEQELCVGAVCVKLQPSHLH